MALPAANTFYEKLDDLLSRAEFDAFVERECRPYYHPTLGQPSLPPATYFLMLLVGYFLGCTSEHGIAFYCADSLTLRRFLDYRLDEPTPDHSTLSGTRRRLPVEVHEAVFRFVLLQAAKSGLLGGEGLALDSSTLDASADLAKIRRRESGLSYQEYLAQLAKESGVETEVAAIAEALK